MYICASKLTIIGTDNDLSLGRRQAIIWTNAGILLTRNFRTDVSESLSKIHTFSFTQMSLDICEMAATLFQSQCVILWNFYQVSNVKWGVFTEQICLWKATMHVKFTLSLIVPDKWNVLFYVAQANGESITRLSTVNSFYGFVPSCPLRTKFLRENINIYLHFMSFLHTNKTQVAEIRPRVRREPAFST